MTKWIDELDGIRAVAISLVLIHHLFHIRLLWMGVDLFFVLSGFLITGVLLDNKVRGPKSYFGHFYQRRARRILPPYLLLLLVTTLFYGLSWTHRWYLYLFLMNFIVAFSLGKLLSLSVLWSLAVEEQFYLVWPFVVYFLDEQAILWAAGSLVVLAPVLRWLCIPMFHLPWAIYSLTPFRMDTLAAGAILQILWRRRHNVIRRFGAYGPILSMIALGVLIVLARNPHFTTTSNTRESNLCIYEMTLIWSTGLIVWALSGRGTRILTFAPVRFFGRISYTVYLIHLAVYFLAIRYLHGEAVVALVVVSITLLYATTSWYLLERPLLFTKVRVRPALNSA